MPITCSACKNRANKNSDISYFVFPLTDPNRLRQWLDACRRNSWIPTKHSRLCSEHFRDEDFYFTSKACRKLQPYAVPSVFNFVPKKSTLDKEVNSDGKSRRKSAINARRNWKKRPRYGNLKEKMPAYKPKKIKDMKVEVDDGLLSFSNQVSPSLIEDTKIEIEEEILPFSCRENAGKGKQLSREDSNSWHHASPVHESEQCDSEFCSHYISMIEEKAKNHKLTRKLEEMEEENKYLRELLQKHNIPELPSIKQEDADDYVNPWIPTCELREEF